MDREFVFERKAGGNAGPGCFFDRQLHPAFRPADGSAARTHGYSVGGAAVRPSVRGDGGHLRWCGGGKPGPVRSLLLCGALVLSIALEVIQGERFYNYVMQQQLAALLFLIWCSARPITAPLPECRHWGGRPGPCLRWRRRRCWCWAGRWPGRCSSAAFKRRRPARERWHSWR